MLTSAPHIRERFRGQVVGLVRTDRTVEVPPRTFEPNAGAIAIQARPVDHTGDRRDNGVTSGERNENRQPQRSLQLAGGPGMISRSGAALTSTGGSAVILGPARSSAWWPWAGFYGASPPVGPFDVAPHAVRKSTCVDVGGTGLWRAIESATGHGTCLLVCGGTHPPADFGLLRPESVPAEPETGPRLRSRLPPGSHNSLKELVPPA